MPEGPDDAAFALEAEELARKLDGYLLEIQHAEDSTKRAPAIMAALQTAHTLKGMASVVGQPAIASVCHLLEGLLKQLAQDNVAPSAQTGRLLLDAGSGLCDAARAVSEGRPCDPILHAIAARLENPAAPVAQQEQEQPPDAAPIAPAAVSMAPAVRVTDQKLDTIHALSEELHYSAARLRLRQDQLDALYDDFALLMTPGRKSETAAECGRELLNRLEDTKAAIERSSRNLQQVSTGLEQQLRGLRLVSLGVACGAFKHAVYDLASSLGKEVDFSIEDSGTEVDRSVIESLREPLLHLIRNAIDHGLETPQERRAKGKPATGHLRISATTKGSWTEIVIEDDGRGIDTAAVRRRAAELHLPEPADDAACMDLLFGGGISTAAAVTQLSGRGLGLSIVRDRVQQLHGRTGVATIAGHGSRFTITVPTTLNRMRLLFLAQGTGVFGVPSHSVQRLIRLGEEQLSAGIELESTKILPLFEVLGMQEQESARYPWREAFVLNDGSRQSAFVVDALLREDEAVVKSLGRRLKSASAYLGGTLLPDGGVALVLNADYLMNSALGGVSASYAPPARRPAKRVILAEDSDTLRAMGKRFLEEGGFEVLAAVNGRQAFELWEKSGADILVTDLEMPIMDGIALTRAIRQIAGREPKIVLFSASGTEDDRKAATEAGIDAFVVKGPLMKRQLLEAVNC